MSVIEKRRYIRVKIVSRVDVYTGLAESSFKQQLHGTGLDVSVNGLQIGLNTPMEIGDEVLLTFNVHNEVVECPATVVRVHRDPRTLRYRIGCQFKEVSEATYLKLNNYIWGRLKEEEE